MKRIINLTLLYIAFNMQVSAQSPARNGKDYAVLFYCTEFENTAWDVLPLTEHEAKELGKELKDNFGFDVYYVANPTLKIMRDKLNDWSSRTYNPNDQLFLFFTMHGHFDEEAENGYLIPKDGDVNDFATWLSYTDLRTYLARNKCKHIYVGLDACHSGSFAEKSAPDAPVWEKESTCSEQIEQALRYKSRLFATSGSKAARTPGNSLFAKKILETLRRGGKNGIVSADIDVFPALKQVAVPRPQGGTFKGHEEGGDFVFIRKNTCSNTLSPIDDSAADKVAWRNAKQQNTEVAYNQYLSNYPDGLYDEEAKDKIEGIKKAAIINSTHSTALVKSAEITETHDGLNLKMTFIEGGSFTMGCTSEQKDCVSDEKPTHQVTLSDFYMGKYEITQRQWRYVMGTEPSEHDCDDCPVESVSWDDVQDFLSKLNSKTGKKYRLPTEAEWEYAARERGKAVLFGNGKNIADPNEMNFDARSAYKTSYSVAGAYRAKTTSVGTFSPNSLGLYDMAGNVWEWCNDWKGDYNSSSQTNPTGASSGSDRVIRGGSWRNLTQSCRVAFRGNNTPVIRNSLLGFRVALSQ